MDAAAPREVDNDLDLRAEDGFLDPRILDILRVGLLSASIRAPSKARAEMKGVNSTPAGNEVPPRRELEAHEVQPALVLRPPVILGVAAAAA